MSMSEAARQPRASRTPPKPMASNTSITAMTYQYVCEDCGGPRSEGSGRRCLKCWRKLVAKRRRQGAYLLRNQERHQ
jgi:hypothetical protein